MIAQNQFCVTINFCTIDSRKEKTVIAIISYEFFPQVARSADCVDVNVKSQKQKQELGTFVDFKKLDSPPDEDFAIDGEVLLHSLHDDNEVIKCLFPDNTDPIESLLNLPD